nr:hypothetical protein DVH24_033729 [Ipomoea trifida]
MVFDSPYCGAILAAEAPLPYPHRPIGRPTEQQIRDVIKHRMAFECPLNAPVTTMYFALSSLSHTRIDRSQAPENRTDLSEFNASAFTADLCFSKVATKPCFFPPKGFPQTLILRSAEPVKIVPSFANTTAFIASS